MNIFKAIKERAIGSKSLKAKLTRPELKGREETLVSEPTNKKSSLFRGKRSSGTTPGFKGSSGGNGSFGKLGSVIEELANKFKRKPRPEIPISKPAGLTDEEQERGKDIFKEYFENKNKMEAKARFEEIQIQRNSSVAGLREQMNEFDVMVADENGYLEPDKIPFELLIQDMEEYERRVISYFDIIEDAEKAIKTKLIEGYDNFLHMMICTIVPDMNEGFIEELKNAFSEASLAKKSQFLENWWREIRLVYEDIKSGCETLWGLEIQESIAQAMLADIQGKGYENTWL